MGKASLFVLNEYRCDFFSRMARKLSNFEKRLFAEFIRNHPTLVEFEKNQREYVQLCAILKWNLY